MITTEILYRAVRALEFLFCDCEKSGATGRSVDALAPFDTAVVVIDRMTDPNRLVPYEEPFTVARQI